MDLSLREVRIQFPYTLFILVAGFFIIRLNNKEEWEIYIIWKIDSLFPHKVQDSYQGYDSCNHFLLLSFDSQQYWTANQVQQHPFAPLATYVPPQVQLSHMLRLFLISFVTVIKS